METWLNTKNIAYIWHGEWADPELEFEGHKIDYWSIEDFCCSEMKEAGLDYNNNDVFAKWVKDNQSLIEATIVEFSDACIN